MRDTYMAFVKPSGNTAPLLDCHRDGCGASMCIQQEVEVDIISLVREMVRVS
jgi:hypothetical protein